MEKLDWVRFERDPTKAEKYEILHLLLRQQFYDKVLDLKSKLSYEPLGLR
jgi:hypothetical protein